MRNTLEHPVTLEEKLRALDDAIEHFRSLGLMGDIRGYVLTLVRDELANQPTE